ncbi:MAG: hypothetical protein Q8R83_07525 [Legionellaceae bacterium]|nr:hypothetical protein [Legionellaceae bacterium]
MKKISVIAFILGAGYFAIGQAGTIGADSTSPQVVSGVKPYLSVDSSYTWIKAKGYSINNRTPFLTSKPWGGRLAAGFNYPISETVRLSAEFGGGYYGEKAGIAPAVGYNCRATTDGYDLLVGAIYGLRPFDLFGGVGVMSQNRRVTLKQNLSLNSGGQFSGVLTQKYNATQSLPEVKVGGIYNLNNNIALSLAYMHVFGTNLQATYTISATSQNGFIDTRNTTLDSILLGIRYYIV